MRRFITALQFLTVIPFYKDLKINEQAITDVVNDAQSNLRIMKDGQTLQKTN